MSDKVSPRPFVFGDDKPYGYIIQNANKEIMQDVDCDGECSIAISKETAQSLIERDNKYDELARALKCVLELIKMEFPISPDAADLEPYYQILEETTDTKSD